VNRPSEPRTSGFRRRLDWSYPSVFFCPFLFALTRSPSLSGLVDSTFLKLCWLIPPSFFFFRLPWNSAFLASTLERFRKSVRFLRSEYEPLSLCLTFPFLGRVHGDRLQSLSPDLSFNVLERSPKKIILLVVFVKYFAVRLPRPPFVTSLPPLCSIVGTTSSSFSPPFRFFPLRASEMYFGFASRLRLREVVLIHDFEFTALPVLLPFLQPCGKFVFFSSNSLFCCPPLPLLPVFVFCVRKLHNFWGLPEFSVQNRFMVLWLPRPDPSSILFFAYFPEDRPPVPGSPISLFPSVVP